MNEPMAFALHAVDGTAPIPGDLVVFGAGPIGPGVLLGYRRTGGSHVVVGLVPSRLQKAPRVGADAVIDSSRQDLVDALINLHGDGSSGLVRGRCAGADVFLSAAGPRGMSSTVGAMAKHLATLGSSWCTSVQWSSTSVRCSAPS